VKKTSTYYKPRALAVCAQVADKLNIPEDTRRFMRIAAVRSPYKAWACYTAIINSYKNDT